MTNPFIINGKIPERYFCNRDTETKTLIDRLINGHNVILMSPRRMGKTGLIEHCYAQPQLNKYHTFLLIFCKQVRYVNLLTALANRYLRHSSRWNVMFWTYLSAQ